jgi:hypothetical protein
MSKHFAIRALLLAALTAVPFTAQSYAASSQKTPPLPQGAHMMTPFEIVKLYRGKTWVWPNGGGYFEPGARFFAWSSGTDNTSSYAMGRWMVTEDGRVCMKATWFSGGKGTPATTCFAHSVAGNVIYQRKMPAGNWYVFRADPPAATDEFANLKDGDLVKEKIAELGGPALNTTQ